MIKSDRAYAYPSDRSKILSHHVTAIAIRSKIYT